MKNNRVLKFQADPSLGIIVGEIKPSVRVITHIL